MAKGTPRRPPKPEIDAARERFPGVCERCLPHLVRLDREFSKQTPYQGQNQFAPRYKWQGHDLTPIEWDIIRALRAARSPLSQKDLARILYGPVPPGEDPEPFYHRTRRRIDQLRQKLTGWSIVRDGHRGYRLTRSTN